MSLWCSKHSRVTPDLTRCPQCAIEILTARVVELEATVITHEETWRKCGSAIQVMTNGTRYREALEKIESQSQDCLRNTCQSIAHFALHPKP